VNKADLIKNVSSKTNLPAIQTANLVNVFLAEIQAALNSGEKVLISDFGSFEISTRRAFKGHNPRSGAEIDVPSRRIPVFRAGKGLKESLNG